MPHTVIPIGPPRLTRRSVGAVARMTERQDTVEPVIGADALVLEPKLDPPDGGLKKPLFDEVAPVELAVEELDVTRDTEETTR